ncbi:addiction module protein [bacterium]|nr:addiction module protein [bacterium]
MRDEWLASILQLSPAERVRIAQLIWESVDEVPDAHLMSDEQRQELSRRLADFEENGTTGRPWRDVLQDITSPA